MLRFEGKVYAYQQKIETWVEDDRGGDVMYDGYGVGLGITTIPTDEHRLRPIKETLNDESVKELVRQA